MSSILNADGSTLVNESYTAYGLRRNPTTWNGSASSVDLSVSAGVTRQGYTWQTALGNMGLNHMNGRVQDAITGVFLSPDPYISEPGNPQNYNRYSYVLNNPLSFTDPSGYRRIKVKRPKLYMKRETTYYIDRDGGYHDVGTNESYVLEWETVEIDIPSFSEVGGFVLGLFNFPDGGTDNSSSGGDGKNTEEFAQTQKSVLGKLKDFVCSLPSGEVGVGADVYAGLGTSIGVGFKIDLASGQIGISGSLAFGVGFGADIGPSVGGSPSGSGIVSANATASGGVGLGVAGVATQNLVGSDAGQRGYSVGRVGTPIGFANVGASVGLSTPKANIFGCKK